MWDFKWKFFKILIAGVERRSLLHQKLLAASACFLKRHLTLQSPHRFYCQSYDVLHVLVQRRNTFHTLWRERLTKYRVRCCKVFSNSFLIHSAYLNCLFQLEQSKKRGDKSALVKLWASLPKYSKVTLPTQLFNVEMRVKLSAVFNWISSTIAIQWNAFLNCNHRARILKSFTARSIELQ